jgi:hypothetical protein
MFTISDVKKVFLSIGNVLFEIGSGVTGIAKAVIFGAEKPVERDRTNAKIKSIVESGNERTLTFPNCLESSRANAPFKWFVIHVEPLSFPINNFTWKIVEDEQSLLRQQLMISCFLRMVQTPNLWREEPARRYQSPLEIPRYNYAERLNGIYSRRNTEQARPEARNRRKTESENHPQADTEAAHRARQSTEQERHRKTETTRKSEATPETQVVRAELEDIIGKFSTLTELARNYRRWSVRGGHPDKGGSAEGFHQVQNLMEVVKRNWTLD